MLTFAYRLLEEDKKTKRQKDKILTLLEEENKECGNGGRPMCHPFILQFLDFLEVICHVCKIHFCIFKVIKKSCNFWPCDFFFNLKVPLTLILEKTKQFLGVLQKC